MSNKIKLKDILAEAFEDTPTTDKRQTLESVKNFGVVGKSIYGGANIMEIAKQLSDIAESAHNHVLSETDDWFDKVSVSKNMDNDGKDEPDDEEYMDNKDAAIKKAMKATKEGLDKRPVRRLKDIGSVTTGIPMLGDMIKNK